MAARNTSAPRTEYFDRTWMLKARTILNLRQEDVADACNISVGAYNKIENGLTTPNVKLGIMITDVLGTDIRNFLNERKIA